MVYSLYTVIILSSNISVGAYFFVRKYPVKYVFTSLFFVSSILNVPSCRAEQADAQARVHKEEGQIFFDIDAMQEEMVENNIAEQLDTRPPLPPRVMVWLRIIGLPLMNAFVAVRKVVRNAWHRIVAATVIITRNSRKAPKAS